MQTLGLVISPGLFCQLFCLWLLCHPRLASFRDPVYLMGLNTYSPLLGIQRDPDANLG